MKCGITYNADGSKYCDREATWFQVYKFDTPSEYSSVVPRCCDHAIAGERGLFYDSYSSYEEAQEALVKREL